MDKTKVFVMFDGCCCTWNVMDKSRNCLVFGTAEEINDWLLENNAHYQECDESEVINHNNDLLSKVA